MRSKRIHCFMLFVAAAISLPEFALADEFDFASLTQFENGMSLFLNSNPDPLLSSVQSAVSGGSLVLQVRVFPHDNALENLNVPQGSEIDPTSVRLEFSSAEKCKVFGATFGTDRVWKKDQARGEWSSGQVLSPTTVPNAQWVECPVAFTLMRSNGENFSYEAPFVVSVKNGKPRVILLITLEEYLKGVIPSEMPLTWPKESLKAQSLAARTYALWTAFVSRNGGTGIAPGPEFVAPLDYDMDDTVFYQAYKGINYLAPQSNAAVEETAGQVLSFGDRLIKSYFAADAGGITENAADVWGGPMLPYTLSKKESFEPAPTSFRSKTILASDLAAELTAQLNLVEGTLLAFDRVPGASFVRPDIVDLRVTETTASGRARKVELIFADGTTQMVSGLDFRYGLRLRSSLFTFTKSDITTGEPLAFTFNTVGFGHGVGLSQVGAKTLAEKGWTYDSILKDYYTGVDIISLYAH